MTCEEALLLLSGHLDQENTVEEEAQLRAHLTRCASCRELLAVLQGNDEAVGNLTQNAPEDLCANVMQSIRLEAAEKKKRRFVWKPVAIAAALVAVIGIGALALPKTTDSTVDPSAASEPVELAKAEVQTQPAAFSMDVMRVAEQPVEECYSLTMELAAERCADVVWLQQLPADLTVSGEPETIGGGWLLYTLPEAGMAEALSVQYQAELAQPAEPDPDCTVSYALVKK